MSGGLSRFSDDAFGGGAVFAAEQLVLFAFETVVVDEELLELVKKAAGEIAPAADVGILMVGFGDSQQAVVPNLLFAVQLFAFNDADEAGTHGNAGKSRLVHQQQDIEGVAVRCKGPGQKTEVVREAHACRQNRLDGKDSLLGIEGKLVAAALGGFNDDEEEAVLFIDGLELGRVGQTFRRTLCHLGLLADPRRGGSRWSNYVRERGMRFGCLGRCCERLWLDFALLNSLELNRISPSFFCRMHLM